MPELWMPGVPRLESTRRVELLGGPALCTWHTMEASPDTWTAERAAEYLRAEAKEAHFTFHPVSGQLVQLLPANTGARTLVYDAVAKVPTNGHGRVHIQVEVVGYASQPWTSKLSPAGAAKLRELCAWLRSWGVPDRWCHGVRPPAYPGGGVVRRIPQEDGHTHHALWQHNTHGDPGAIGDPWAYGVPLKPARALAVRVQSALAGLGYSLAPWGVDGSWGAVSQAALEQYRQDFGYATTGYPDTTEAAQAEADMAKIDELLAEQRATRTEQKARYDALSAGISALAQQVSVHDQGTRTEVREAVNTLAGLVQQKRTVEVHMHGQEV